MIDDRDATLREAAADPSDGADADDASPAADWGIAPRRSWMESNTKFGIALIVLLVGMLGFVVYKKMEKRRAELAASGKADAFVNGNELASNSRRRTTTAYEERDATTRNGVPQKSPPSEPASRDDGPQSQSVAYRHTSTRQSANSTPVENPFDRPAVHPLRGTAATAQSSVIGGAPNPFDARQHAGAATSVGNQSADAAAVTNLFDQPDETAVQAGSATEGAAQIGSESGGSAAEAHIQSAQRETASGMDRQRDELHSDWSAASAVQVQAATAPSGRNGDPSQTVAAPVSDDAPWSQHSARAATHSVAAPAPEATSISPVSSGYDHVPRTAPPTRAATPAEQSPWDVAGQHSGTPSAASSSANPFDEAPFTQQSTHSVVPRPEFDSMPVAGAGQPFLAADDRPAVYVVRSGDNYWAISRKQYGTARYFRALALYNSHRIPDPRRMRAGMKVLVPDRQVLQNRFPQLFPRSSGGAQAKLGPPAGLFHDASGQVMCRVGKNDTLGGIAQRHLGRSTRWNEIYQLNRDRLASPTALKIGTELRLPADASRVRVVSQPGEVR